MNYANKKPKTNQYRPKSLILGHELMLFPFIPKNRKHYFRFLREHTAQPRMNTGAGTVLNAGLTRV